MYGVRATTTVSDVEARAAQLDLLAHGLAVGELGAAVLAGLTAIATSTRSVSERRLIGLAADSNVLVVVTNGLTGADLSP
ncbi:MAG: hypothetical protein WCH31_03160 [Actinomycetes bacterium]